MQQITIKPGPKIAGYQVYSTLEYMLNHPKELDKWAFNVQTRVVEHFTLFSQIEAWLRLFQKILKTA